MNELTRSVEAAERTLRMLGATNVIVIAMDDNDMSVTIPKDSYVIANLIMFTLDKSPEMTKEIVKNFLMMGGNLS